MAKSTKGIRVWARTHERIRRLMKSRRQSMLVLLDDITLAAENEPTIRVLPDPSNAMPAPEASKV
jgi:hypothetical protein